MKENVKDLNFVWKKVESKTLRNLVVCKSVCLSAHAYQRSLITEITLKNIFADAEVKAQQ